MNNSELTQKMYDLIEQNVNDGFKRMEMYDLLDEIKERMS